jgi:hypothetical protein
MIGRVVLEELVANAAEIRLAGPSVRKANRMLRGFDSLPLTVRARRP